MSEINIFVFSKDWDFTNIFCESADETGEDEEKFVRLADHEKHVAALREELAEKQASAEMFYQKQRLAETKQANVERKLAAAEQRNAKLVSEITSLPDEFKSLSGSENTAGVYACIDYISEWVAEQTQPTESKVPGPKLCIECDKPYCHGVCVERGDELEPNE